MYWKTSVAPLVSQVRQGPAAAQNRLISAVTGGVLRGAVRDALMRLVRSLILVRDRLMGSAGGVVHAPGMSGTGARRWYEDE